MCRGQVRQHGVGVDPGFAVGIFNSVTGDAYAVEGRKSFPMEDPNWARTAC
jgi:hypothetical protein